jgi:hypothetical protein
MTLNKNCDTKFTAIQHYDTYANVVVPYNLSYEKMSFDKKA